MSAQIVQFFFTMREQLKLHHWQTMSFARHKATDHVIKELDELIDQFVEVWMGSHTRPRVTAATCEITLKNLSEVAATKFVKGCIGYIQGPLTKALKPTETELMNIRDEMLSNLQQLLYLFTLK